MNAPNLGQVVYLGPNREKPHTVLNRLGDKLFLCPSDKVWTTHQGNVYNDDGDRQWAR